MPNEISREEQERLEVEAMIKSKQELQEVLIKKAVDKGIKVIYLNHKNSTYEGRALAIISIEDKEAGLVCRDDYTAFDWYGLFMLHNNRIKILEEILNSDNVLDNDYVWGILDKDNKLHTKDGVKQLNFEPQYSKGLNYYYYKDGDQYKYIVQEKESQFQTCCDCGKRIFVESDMVKTDNGSYYCKRCAEMENIGVCDICGHVHKRIKLKVDADNKLPDRSDEIGSTINICYSCADRLYNRCENCGKFIRKPNIACEECKYSVILNYSTKPAPVFHKNKNEKSKSYFGWEWEVEAKHSARDIAKIANKTGEGLLYCKHDGSIHNGCEIVTHPMTYNFFKKNEKMFKEMFENIKKAGGHSFDMENTGVHVHISRDAFINKDHIINFARCISQPVDYSEFISLRKGNRYAHYNKSTTSEIKRNLECPRDRYRAVNFCNSNTIEVRIYKGTINYDAILMYLQHIICCMEYAKTMNVSGRFSSDKLIDYILSKKCKDYGMLKARTKVFKYLNSKYSVKE